MKETKITAGQVLFPLSLVSFVLLLFVAFQTSQVLRDRDSLHQAKAQQNVPMEEANRVQAQFTALALGTKRMADGGDKDAEMLVERMRKLGVVFDATPTPPHTAEGAAVPSDLKP